MNTHASYNKSNEKKINKSLNVIKCLAVFCVICLHCHLSSKGTFGLVVDSLSRFAVPMFFMISGFYSFYDNNDFAIQKYKKRIIRLIRLLLISIIIYVIFFNITLPNYHLPHFDINSIIKYVMFNVSPAGFHLWFLEALIYCYIIFLILGKLNIKYDYLYYLIPVLLLELIILCEVTPLLGIKIDPMIYRNFLFMGMPFFTLGYLIHDKERKICEMFSDGFIILTIIAMIILTLMEAYITRRLDTYVGIIILTIMLFIWCVKNPLKLDSKVFGWIGANLYGYIYVLHYMFILLLLDIIPVLYLKPIIIFIVTGLASFIIFKIKNSLI